MMMTDLKVFMDIYQVTANDIRAFTTSKDFDCRVFGGQESCKLVPGMHTMLSQFLPKLTCQIMTTICTWVH